MAYRGAFLTSGNDGHVSLCRITIISSQQARGEQQEAATRGRHEFLFALLVANCENSISKRRHAHFRNMMMESGGHPHLFSLQLQSTSQVAK
jgi:hypothetical protein